MKKVTQFLGLLLPMLVLGQATSAKKFENSIQLGDTKENVWKAMTDFSTFSVWDNNVIDVRCPELKKNQNCQAIVGAGKLVDVAIVEYNENQSYTIRYKLSSGNVYVQRKFSSSDPLELTETVWYKGISKNTFEKYKGAAYADTLKMRLQRFKAFVERDYVQEGR